MPLALACALLIGLLLVPTASASSFFAPTGSLGAARYRAAAAPLPDGRVLLAGGGTVDDVTPVSSAEVFIAATDSFSSAGIGPMGTARMGAAGAPLPGGYVLVAGGNGSGGAPIYATAEVFIAATDSFSSAGIGSLGTARTAAAAAPLPDGRVLVAGGINGASELGSSEIFDPATHSFTPTGSLGTARFGAAAAPLPDGRVLVAGGHDGAAPLASSEIFDPATNSFSPTGSLGTARWDVAAAPLPDGRVLVIGGLDASSTALASSEIFDPATNSFAPTGSLGTARYGAAAAPLPDGRVLVAGGINFGTPIASAEVFLTEPDAVSAGAGFSNLAVGSQSADQPLTVTNRGAQALLISGAALGGANPGDYAITDNACQGETLAFNESCAIKLRFAPSATGPRPASLALTYNAATSPRSFPLTGTGLPSTAGPQGPAGPAGPQGPPGRNATVTCKSKGKKKVKCRVAFASAAGVRWARLSRQGVTYAEGKPTASGTKLVLRFGASRRPEPGLYTLSVVQLLDGSRVVTKSAVRVK